MFDAMEQCLYPYVRLRDQAEYDHRIDCAIRQRDSSWVHHDKGGKLGLLSLVTGDNQDRVGEALHPDVNFLALQLLRPLLATVHTRQQ